VKRKRQFNQHLENNGVFIRVEKSDATMSIPGLLVRSSCKEPVTMQYLLLIYESEQERGDRSPEQFQAEIEEYFAFNDELKAGNHMLAGDALESVSTATTVRVRDGKAVHTDGPFAETKEQLGGCYLIEADDLDQALMFAAKIPAARTGSIEVRPVMQIPPRS
jgi:hypothetical protein